MGTDVIAMLLDDAENLSAQKEELREKAEANRKALRVLAEAGALTEEQVVAVDAYYPPRKRKGEGETN